MQSKQFGHWLMHPCSQTGTPHCSSASHFSFLAETWPSTSPAVWGHLTKILPSECPAVRGFLHGFAGEKVKVPTIPRGWGLWLQMTSALQVVNIGKTDMIIINPPPPPPPFFQYRLSVSWEQQLQGKLLQVSETTKNSCQCSKSCPTMSQVLILGP